MSSSPEEEEDKSFDFCNDLGELDDENRDQETMGDEDQEVMRAGNTGLTVSQENKGPNDNIAGSRHHSQLKPDAVNTNAKYINVLYDDWQQLQRENHDLSQKLLEQKKSIVRKDNQLKAKNHEYMRLQDKCKQDKTSFEEKKQELISQHATEKEQLLKEIQRLLHFEDECQAKGKRIHELEKQQERSNTAKTELKNKLDRAEGTIHSIRKDNHSLEEEKKRLLYRLSQLAGAKLTLDNPNIADLSDTKRPTKLAEEFAELYDNEWTDAFEDVKVLNEQTKTTFMLKLLQRASEICTEVSNAHMDGIKKSLCTLKVPSNDHSGSSSKMQLDQKISITMDNKEKEDEEMTKAKRSRRNSQQEHTEPQGPSMVNEVTCDFNILQHDQKKTIMELRKCIEVKLSEDLETVVTDVIAMENDFDQETQVAVFKYIAKCVNICWSMCRVEPPVFITFPEVQGDLSLDTNVYKPYTKTGKYIDYIVWPAVYLHENGPLLCKGVAQGRT